MSRATRRPQLLGAVRVARAVAAVVTAVVAAAAVVAAVVAGFGGGGGSSTGKHYNFALGFQVQNLFNNKDLAAPNGTLLSRQFGEQTQLAGGPYTTNAAVRRISLQASFNF